MATKKDLDPNFILKKDFIIFSFSPQVTFFEDLVFFREFFFSFSIERRGGDSKDGQFLKRRDSLSTEKFSF